MGCYSEQIVSLFVEGELAVEEARRLRDHLATCRRCRQLLDALRAENRVLSESLQELPEEAASPAGFSRSQWSMAWGDVVFVAAVLALGSIVAVWTNELSIPEALQWLNPFSLSGRTNLIFNLSYYFVDGGTAMLRDYAAVVGELFLLLLLGGSALLLGRRRRLHQPGLRLLIVLLALSLPGFALDRRHSALVTVAANETLDDTLLASGNIVRVEGVVNGDLLAFGGSVEVRGTVKGDLVSFAKRTVVSGTVGGNIYNFSSSLDLDGQLGHSIYALVQSLRMNDRGRVGDGMVVAAGDVSLEGEVNRSVTMFTGNADVSGSIGRELTMTGDRLTLTNTARIGGSLSARVHELKNVHIADGAKIVGTRDIQMRVRQNRFARPRFYFYQAVWLAAAMLVGWLGLVLFPGFFQASTHAVGSGWRSLGLGVGVLAGVPVAIVVTAITLVGIPVSLMLLAMYLAAIYLAKVWVGAFLGQILLKPAGATKSDWLLGLLVGLLILTIVGFIPYLGGLVRLGVVCLGLGAFAWQLYRASRPAITT
ncbi:MAG: zf-HC2 domain-containing protein [Acidobacteriia bacterium]|nr:zf-HC2 domain-containing protein [Terriglobia bacterium]